MGEREFGMSTKVVRLSSGPPAAKRRKVAHTDHAKIQRLQRQVNALRPELKIFEGSIAPTFPNNANGAIDYLSKVAQGSDNINRIADKISPKYIDIIISITGTPGSVTSNLFQYNFYLVKDLESNGVIPTVSGAQGIFTSPDPIKATLNTSTRERFKVLGKWMFPVGMILSGNSVNTRQVRVRLSGQSWFHGTAGAQASAGKNSYYLVLLSSSTAAVTTESAQYEYTIGFTDV